MPEVRLPAGDCLGWQLGARTPFRRSSEANHVLGPRRVNTSSFGAPGYEFDVDHGGVGDSTFWAERPTSSAA